VALLWASTLFMVFGGPVLWWLFVRVLSTPPASPVARIARGASSRLGFVIMSLSGVVLFVVPVRGTANSVASTTWMVGGLLTVWSVSAGRWGLPQLARRRFLRTAESARTEARSGNPAAMYLIGVILVLDGDLAGARPWLEEAAKAGVRDAQWDLARLLDETEGPHAAHPWFEAAAQAGHPGALELARPGSAQESNPTEAGGIRASRGRAAARANDRAIPLSQVYERTGNTDSFKAALAQFRESVVATPRGRAAARANDRAISLSREYERTGNADALESALALFRKALAAIPPDHPARPRQLSNLANVLLTRFERTGHQADLDEAIALGWDAVVATPTGHPTRPGLLSNLGNALRARLKITHTYPECPVSDGVGPRPEASTSP
jgi:tetratricopeptide (TPR) repeat protein